jgi:fatty acid desaturase
VNKVSTDDETRWELSAVAIVVGLGALITLILIGLWLGGVWTGLIVVGVPVIAITALFVALDLIASAQEQRARSKRLTLGRTRV